MGDFAAWFFLLLLPIVLLLFASLRLKRRVVFPLHFFSAAPARPSGILLRILRLRYDTVLDVLAALVVASALAGFPAAGTGTTAVVLDGSRSMLRGEPGARALDRAVTTLYSRPDLEKARVLLLDYDPYAGKYRLRDFTAERRQDSAEAFSARLARESQALGADWSLLTGLRKRGVDGIVVFTDEFPHEAEGFEVVEAGFPSLPYAYPASAGYEEATGSWALRLVREGEPEGLVVHRWDDAAAGFSRLASNEMDLSEGPSGWTLRFPRPGLVLIGVGEETFPVLLPPRPARPDGSGTFSEAMASVFAFLPDRPGRGLRFLDAETAAGTSGNEIVVARVSEDSPLLEDPGRTYGGIVPLAVPQTGQVALGNGGLESPDLPLLFWLRLQADLPAPYASSPEAAGPGYKPMGTGYYRMTKDGAYALIPPVGEYAPAVRYGVLRLPPRIPSRWPHTAVLLIVYALKLAIRKRFSSERGGGPRPTEGPPAFRSKGRTESFQE